MRIISLVIIFLLTMWLSSRHHASYLKHFFKKKILTCDLFFLLIYDLFLKYRKGADEANSCAYSVAKEEVDVYEPMIVLKEPPEAMQSLLSADFRGTCCPRA